MIHSIGYSPCPSKKWLFMLCVCARHPTWYDCGKVALGTYVCWRLGLYGCLCRDADVYIVEVYQLLCTVGRWTVSELLNHHTLHGCGQTHQYNWYLICPGLGFKTFHWLDKYKHIWSCHIVWTHTLGSCVNAVFWIQMCLAMCSALMNRCMVVKLCLLVNSMSWYFIAEVNQAYLQLS